MDHVAVVLSDGAGQRLRWRRRWRRGWRRRRWAAGRGDREVALHDGDVRVALVPGRARLEGHSPRLVARAVDVRGAIGWRNGVAARLNRRAEQPEVVERRVVGDLERVCAGGKGAGF